MNYSYEDVLLCDESSLLSFEYVRLQVIITTKEYRPLMNISYPQLNIRAQMITSEQNANLGFLQRLDDRLNENYKETIILEPHEQTVLGFTNAGNAKTLYTKIEVIEKLSKAIQPFII